MNLDHPNKNERQMKETVQQYKAPFDPKAWEDMKSKLAESPKHPNAGGKGNAKSDSSPGTFFNFKNLLLMTLIFVFFTTIFWNVFNINPTTNTTDLINENSTISINENTENKNETILNLDRNTTATNENNEDISKQQLTAKVLDVNAPDSNSKDKTSVTTTNQNNDSDKSRGNNDVKKSGTSTDKLNTLQVDQADGLATSNRGANIDNQVTGNVEDRNFNPITTTLNTEEGLASNLPSEANNADTKAIASKAELGKVDLLPNRFGDLLPNEIEDLDLSLNPNDPVKKVKMKRFSLGVFGGTSYSMFSKPNSFNIVGGAMAKFKVTKQLSIQSDISWRNMNANNTQHFESRIREDNNGLLIEDRMYEATLNNVQIFESSFLLSYQLRKPNFPISRIFGGIRPVLFNAPEYSRRESFTVGISPEPVIPWDIDNSFRAGFSKFDLGAVLGFEVPISKRLYLDTRVNVNFKDMTDEVFWNVDPKKNTFSDIQLTLRWDLFNF